MNTLKKYCFTGFFFTVILGTLSHFIYEWSSHNPVAALFTPVNESAWEHMKLLFFPALLFGLPVNYRLRARFPGYLRALFESVLAGTWAIPVLFYTYTGILGTHCLPLDIGVFLISTGILSLLTYKNAKHETGHFRTIMAGIGIFLMTLAFFIFSFWPPALGLFESTTF